MNALLLAVALANPIIFVTQVPLPGDFTSVVSAFGNQVPSMQQAPRGGDLWIRYPDGTMKNLTRAAGFGAAGMQGSSAIAVREPSVHWSGTKALFSMVVGARRISVGGALARTAWGGFMAAAREIAEKGTFSAFGNVMPGTEINALFDKMPG